MKKIKFGIALITTLGLLLGTVGIAGAQTASPVHHAKVSSTSTKNTHHPTKSVHKTIKPQATHISKHITKNA